MRRAEAKSLDGRFLKEIRGGLNCSPFEAEAVLGVVREVYGPFFSAAAAQAPPGRVSLVAVAADEPAGKPLAECEKVTLALTVHRGPEDDRVLVAEGPAAFRRTRIPDLLQEAFSQGGLLTREDLAHRVFFVGPRTISRDLALLRRAEPARPLPLRSTVCDIGPVLTHRVHIVRLALAGKTTAEISALLRHSPTAIANYLSTFTRCAQLAEARMHASQIAFLLRRGPGLIRQYLALLAECERNPNYGYHLRELRRVGRGPQAAGGKKGRGGVRHGRRA
jgi:hypothetical protein